MNRSTIKARLIAACVLAILAGSVPGFVGPVQAATIGVTTTVDELSTNGLCSLREAILAANRNQVVDSCRAGGSKDTIQLPAGTYLLSLEGILEDAGETGDLDITQNLVIRGAGRLATHINANAIDRAFDVIGGIVVRMQDIHVYGGNTEFPQEQLPGDGGAIRSEAGNLRLDRTRIEGDARRQPICHACGDGWGGAVANGTGVLTVIDSELYGESGQYGGAVSNRTGVVTIKRSTLTGQAVTGGGIYNDAGRLVVINTTIERSSANWGGGIAGGFNGGASVDVRGSIIVGNGSSAIAMSSGHLVVTDSKITDNYGWSFYGTGTGGIYLGPTTVAVLTRVTLDRNSGDDWGGIRSDGLLTINDSLIADNFAWHYNPSGISGVGPFTTIINTTITGNSGQYGGAAVELGDSMVRSSTIVDSLPGEVPEFHQPVGILAVGTVSLANTVIANNSESGPSRDCSGAFISLGYNLIETVPSECTITGNTSTDIYGADPMLGELADNGGSTLSHMPLPGSPLIDSANPARPGEQSASCPRLDQIGTRRPQEGNGDGIRRCDIGAIERPPAAP